MSELTSGVNSLATQVDPVTLAVLDARLNRTTVEMGIVMIKTARSPIFSEGHDFSCFLADRHGRVIAQADGLPIHTGSGGFAIRAVLAAWGDRIGPGDVFLLNDPYTAGGNHLPDWTLIEPVFAVGRLIGFAANRAHQADIGGGVIGSYNSSATDIYQEGLRLPALRLIEGGAHREDVWELLRLNCRLPEIMESDLNAMLASTHTGARGMLDIVARYGADETEHYTNALLDAAEVAMRAEIERIPDGVYLGIDSMNNDVFEQRDVKVQATITVTGSEMVVDFAGTAAQIRGFKNSALTNTHACVYLALMALVHPAIRNEGTYRPVHIKAPEGSLVNPIPPAPVTFSTASAAHEIIHAVWVALASAVPGNASAGWGKPIHPISAQQDRGQDDGYVYYHWGAFPGAGAVAGHDGIDQTSTLNTLGGMTIPNCEGYEQLYPVRFIRHEFRTDGGGAGRWRGGTGVHYTVRFEEPHDLVWRGDGLYSPSGFGILGGCAGKAGDARFEPPIQADVPPYYGMFRPHAGTVMHLSSAGGGGWGDPFARDPNMVRIDVEDGVVSVAAARDEYGVVLDPDTLEVDWRASEEIRKAKTGQETAP
jgi:N-methylhydantoinase B